MIELAATPTSATATPTVDHDRLDHMISRIAARDRMAFRCLYAFMAMRVWRIATEVPLCPTTAVAVTRSTFIEVWHSAGTAGRYDARDWLATVVTRHVYDRLRIIDVNGRDGVDRARPHVAADHRNQPPTVADHDAHVHRELTALLGAGGAIIRTSPGVFARIDDLDHALATIAATPTATTGPCSSAAPPPSIPQYTRQR